MPKKKLPHRKSRSSSPLLLPLATLAIVTLGVAIWYSLPRPKPVGINYVGVASGTTTLTLSPSSVNIEPNTESTLTLTLDASSSHVTGAQVEIGYDSGKIGTPTVTLGTFLPNTLASVKTDNNKITFTVGAAPDSGGVTGSGTIATIKIKPTTAGTSSLTFSDNNAVTAVESQTNTLKSASDVAVTVAAAAASAPASAPASADPSTPASVAPSAPASVPPSTPASAPPSTPPSTPPTSPLTTLRTTSNSCNSLAFSWDKLSVASGYQIDLANNSNFDNKMSSGTLGSDRLSYSFSSLSTGTKYYVHLTATGIPDYPHYTALTVTTLSSCGTTITVTPTPKATAKPTPQPTTSVGKTLVATPTPAAVTNNLPVSHGSLNDVFGSGVPSGSPAPTSEPNFFQKVLLGWQVIFQKLASSLFPQK